MNTLHETPNKPIVMSYGLVKLLLTQKNSDETIALVVFLQYHARRQKTNQPKATVGFIAKGLGWGLNKVRRVKKMLKKLDLIEDIQTRDDKGIVSGHYVKVKYLMNESTLTEIERVDGLLASKSTLTEIERVDGLSTLTVSPGVVKLNPNALREEEESALSDEFKRIKRNRSCAKDAQPLFLGIKKNKDKSATIVATTETSPEIKFAKVAKKKATPETSPAKAAKKKATPRPIPEKKIQYHRFVPDELRENPTSPEIYRESMYEIFEGETHLFQGKLEHLINADIFYAETTSCKNLARQMSYWMDRLDNSLDIEETFFLMKMWGCYCHAWIKTNGERWPKMKYPDKKQLSQIRSAEVTDVVAEFRSEVLSSTFFKEDFGIVMVAYAEGLIETRDITCKFEYMLDVINWRKHMFKFERETS